MPTLGCIPDSPGCNTQGCSRFARCSGAVGRLGRRVARPRRPSLPHHTRTCMQRKLRPVFHEYSQRAVRCFPSVQLDRGRQVPGTMGHAVVVGGSCKVNMDSRTLQPNPVASTSLPPHHKCLPSTCARVHRQRRNHCRPSFHRGTGN